MRLATPLSNEQYHDMEESRREMLSIEHSPAHTFYLGYTAATAYSEAQLTTERDASNNWGPPADPEAWVRIKTSELTDLRREVNTLRHEAQRDKDDATIAATKLVQAERKVEERDAKIAELTDPYSELQQHASAWAAVADHPALRAAYGHGGTLVEGVQTRLDELAEMEKTINELRPVREADTDARNIAVFEEDFRTEVEQQVFTVAYETSRAMSFSIMDTAKVAWMYARRYFEPATTEAEGSKPVATKPPRSPQQLREMAVHIAHRYWSHNADRPLTLIADNVLLFLQEPGNISLRELAAHTAQNLTQAREIYEYLAGSDSTSDFTD